MFESNGDVVTHVARFYKEESKRVVFFDKTLSNPPFDVILIQVCSLSWDDLREAEIDYRPFFSQFDDVFTHFNSVSSYSGPAADRLLRMPCGQTSNGNLYNPAQPSCYLIDQLRKEGYKTYTALNHDGNFGDFAAQIVKEGHADNPMDVSDIPITEISFDGTGIHDDLGVLMKWWRKRQASGAPRAAFYYNTITMHIGSHDPGEKNWWKEDPKTRYKADIQGLFHEITQFIALIRSSGRNAVVIFIPEHGAALKSYSIQARDLRDIPLPQITTVPVAVKIIGAGWPDLPKKPRIINEPVSYLAIAALLSSFEQKPPFGPHARAENAPFQPPQTDFLSENQYFITIPMPGRWELYQGKTHSWSVIPQDAVPAKIGGWLRKK